VSTTSKPGFSFIEIIVAMMIMGIMAALVMPQLLVRGERAVDTFVADIAKITQLGIERAVLTGKVHRIFFDFKADEKPTMSLQVLAEKQDAGGERKFEPVGADYIKTSYPLHNQIAIKNFYLLGVDKAAEGALKTSWYYLLPEGVSQEIIINISDELTGDTAGLVLNPFSVRFTVYDTFQKPYARV